MQAPRFGRPGDPHRLLATRPLGSNSRNFSAPIAESILSTAWDGATLAPESLFRATPPTRPRTLGR